MSETNWNKRNLLVVVALFGLAGLIVVGSPQNQAPQAPSGPIPGGRGERWGTYGNDPQRSGFQRFDRFFTHESGENFQLIWKMQFSKDPQVAITQPVVTEPVITVRGFRDIAVVADSKDNVYGIDIDLGKFIWTKYLDVPAPTLNGADAKCPGGLTANVTFSPPLVFGRGRGFAFFGANANPARSGAGRGQLGDGGVPAPANGAAQGGGARGRGAFGTGGRGFGGNQSAFVVASDGTLHSLAITDGYETNPSLSFLPKPNGDVSSLNLSNDVMYAETGNSCGGLPDAVWAVDMSGDAHAITSFEPQSTGAWGKGGVSIGTDGTVYTQTGDGEFDPVNGEYGNALVALTAKDLQVKDFFSFASGDDFSAKSDEFSVTPTVFQLDGKDLVATAGPDGRVDLLDSKDLGGSDHKTALFQSSPLVEDLQNPQHGIAGGLSTWEDANNTRWVLVPVWGPVSKDVRFPGENGDITHGAIAAFKIEQQSGKLVLDPAWISRDMVAPMPAAIIHGVVFALSGGEPHGPNAVLYALDSQTGKELHSSGSSIDSWSREGLTAANGYVYVTTKTGILYCFGVYQEH